MKRAWVRRDQEFASWVLRDCEIQTVAVLQLLVHSKAPLGTFTCDQRIKRELIGRLGKEEYMTSTNRKLAPPG